MSTTAAHSIILRAIKHNTWSKVGASAGHTWRTTPVPHANVARTHLNEDWRLVSSPEELRVATENRIALADQVRKNSVLLIEYIVSANHDAFIENGGTIEWKEYFKSSLNFFEKMHKKENIIAVNVQLDEHTPHLVIYAVPLIERPSSQRQRNVIIKKEGGKIVRENKTYNIPEKTSLSAYHFIGSREKLRNLQTEFSEKVGIKHNLKRGLRHSAATHVTTKNFHQALIKGLSKNIEISPKELNKKGFLINKESDDEYVERITNLIHEHYKPAIAKSSLHDIEKQRATEMAETARRAESALENERKQHSKTKLVLNNLTAGLSTDEFNKIQKIADNIRKTKEFLKKEKEQHEKIKRKEQESYIEFKNERKAFEIRMISAKQLALLEKDVRKSIWRFAIKRNDLAFTLDKWMDSGLFEPSGELSSIGKRELAQKHENTKSQTLKKENIRKNKLNGPQL
ncbi:MobV family relaxase [Halomonas sp. NYA30]